MHRWYFPTVIQNALLKKLSSLELWVPARVLVPCLAVEVSALPADVRLWM